MNDLRDKLEIIHISKLCSSESFHALFQSSRQKPAQQAQKYYRLMVEGLAAHPNVHVTVVGSLPVTRKISSRLFISAESTVEENVAYQSVGIVNIPFFRHLAMFFGTMAHTYHIIKRNRCCVIVCDVLSIAMAAAALIPAWFTGTKTIGIVTDLPRHIHKESRYLVEIINRVLLGHFSAFLFLTIQMNAVVNKRNRPYVVIEGQIDARMSQRENDLHEKHSERICMYTGRLDRICGVHMLTEAFLLANIPNAVLQFYGVGDYEDTLSILIQKHKNIRFGGVVPNSQIVDEQIKATLLINPRPTNYAYTQYSFPSKNMEYIASGTPLLTTKLPGMPDDYFPHIYIFDEETIEGYAKTLREVLSLPISQLHSKGLKAKIFAMQYKNNITQADKLLRMIRNEFF